MMSTNKILKAEQLAHLSRLFEALAGKASILSALDTDGTAEDYMELSEELKTIQHSAGRMLSAIQNCREINGVEAEYDYIFGRVEQ